jgi:hypothetical protein
MASPELGKVVNQAGGFSAGAQKQTRDLMEKYLVTMNLPSRAQMVSMPSGCSRSRGRSTRSRRCCVRSITIWVDREPVLRLRPSRRATGVPAASRNEPAGFGLALGAAVSPPLAKKPTTDRSGRQLGRLNGSFAMPVLEAKLITKA